MRIGVDTRPLSYQLTGIGVYLINLLDALQEIDDENHYYLVSNGPIHYRLSNPNWYKVEGRYTQKLVSTFWMQIRAPIIATQLELDLFWGTRHNLPLLLPGKTRTVLTIHDVIHRLHPGSMSLQNLIIEHLLVRWSLLKADRVVADSQATAAGLQEYYKINSKKIQTIYLGTPCLISGNEENRTVPGKYFLFVGTLDPRKNFQRILQAFVMLNPQVHNVHLVLVGARGWKNKEFLGEMEAHSLRDHIHLLGYVDRDELGLFYRNALCLLFPSLYEGFGLPILEAMACGTPVITSNVSSMSEVAGDAALLVNPYDVDAIAEAREQLVDKGLERINKFSWEKCAAEMLNVFNLVRGN
jgi:glycosyltransferase involved in cell wall biosynthesis